MNLKPVAVIAGVVLAFGIPFGIAYSVGGDEGPAPEPTTVTQGFDGEVVTTAPSTDAVALPSVRATPTVPDLEVPTPPPTRSSTPNPTPSPSPTPTPSPPEVVTVIEAG